MGFIKHAIIGIAIYEGLKYLVKQDEFGRTKLDDIREQAPEWLEKAKNIKEDIQEGKMPQGL
jgi:hypothetical protein